MNALLKNPWFKEEIKKILENTSNWKKMKPQFIKICGIKIKYILEKNLKYLMIMLEEKVSIKWTKLYLRS